MNSETSNMTAQARETRLLAIRSEAEANGTVQGMGVRPAGSPFPVASAQEGYYRQPLLKEPQWTWAIPLYFFVGGAAGALGVIGSLADVLGDEKTLARDARWLALGGATLSGVLLVYDLGRPARFLNMLRVFKPQSVMSIGSWVLSGFSASATISSLADFLARRFPNSISRKLMSAVGRIGSALFGMPFHNYTGVLIGATVIPVWNSRIKSLPHHFGMSGLQSAVSLLELAGHDQSRALNVLGLLSAAIESRESLKDEHSTARELSPLHHGSSGMLVRTGAILSGPLPIALRIVSWLGGRKWSLARRLAACSGILGSLAVRYGWVQAGTESARDWRIPLGITCESSPTTQP